MFHQELAYIIVIRCHSLPWICFRVQANIYFALKVVLLNDSSAFYETFFTADKNIASGAISL